jgi:hypothetical protein
VTYDISIRRLHMLQVTVLLGLFIFAPYLADATTIDFEIIGGQWVSQGPPDPSQSWSFVAISEDGRSLLARGGSPHAFTAIDLEQSVHYDGMWVPGFTLDGVQQPTCISTLVDSCSSTDFLFGSLVTGEVQGQGCVIGDMCFTVSGFGIPSFERDAMGRFLASITFTTVPEPNTSWFMVLGVLILWLSRLKKHVF